MSSIPVSTSLTESAVIQAPLASVVALLDLAHFEWWSAIKSSAVDASTGIYTWTFHDGTVLTLKREAYSHLDNSLTYSVISASPSLSYTSSLSTIRCTAVTSGHLAGSTFVTWSGEFSGDADVAVVSDARYKRHEALADLAKAAKA